MRERACACAFVHQKDFLCCAEESVEGRGMEDVDKLESRGMKNEESVEGSGMEDVEKLS